MFGGLRGNSGGNSLIPSGNSGDSIPNFTTIRYTVTGKSAEYLPRISILLVRPVLSILSSRAGILTQLENDSDDRIINGNESSAIVGVAPQILCAFQRAILG